MSAQAGIYYFDGRPVPADVAATLARTLAPYGPDGGGEVSPAPGLAMVARRLQVTPEDHGDRQPFELASGAWLTWDGRLDNRADLMVELGMHASPSVPDVHVAAHALAGWGDDTWHRLVGDWSAAMWDPGSRAIVLASDFMGVRPLYYVVTDTYGAWSTALEGLVAITDRRMDLDDEYLQAYVMSCRVPGRTPYRGIRSLLAGHVVRIAGADTPPLRFWHLSHDTIRYRDPRDYAAHLRQLFAEAVRCRLRSDRPVWMELSGGWDSSSIVCMAARLAEAGEVVAPALHTASYVTPQDPEADETRFIEAVEAHTGFPSLHVALDHEAARELPNPTHLRYIDVSRLSLYASARAAGARALTSGRLGDGVMGNFPVDVTSIVHDLRMVAPRRLVNDLRAWSKASGRTAWNLLHEALLWFLPARFEVDAKCRELLGIDFSRRTGSTNDSAFPVPAAAYAAFRDVIATHVRWVRSEAGPFVSRHFAGAIALYSFNRELCSPPEAPDLLLSYPLADRRLVAYLASIPADVLCTPGTPRALMREALGPLLPERIARRFSKSYAAPYTARHVQAQIPWLLDRVDRLVTVQRGYVEAALLRSRLEVARAHLDAVSSVETVLALEHWLERVEDLSTAAA